MLEIEIQCDCGQPYAFDVEPVDGAMPAAVHCPSCGAEGTEQANEKIREILAGAEASEPPPAEVPAIAAPSIPPPSFRTAPPRPAPAVAVPAPVAASAPLAGQTPPGQATPEEKPNFGVGVLGALAGALIGSVLYFVIFNYFNLRLRMLALGVGYLAGFGAALGRTGGSKELSMIAAALTLGGLLASQYYVARNRVHEWVHDAGDSLSEITTYESAAAEAKKVMAALPTGSDEEIRIYLAKEEADPDETPDPKSISDEEIKAFRETSLPEMRDLAGGKLTKETYDKRQEALSAVQNAFKKVGGKGKPTEEDEDDDDPDQSVKTVFVLMLISKFNVLCMAGAAGVAFKVCASR